MTLEFNELELIERSVEGDLDAFSRLIGEHQRAVCACLAVRLKDPHEVEDLAQETFLTAYRNLSTFDAEKSLGPWLRGIAMNLLRNHWRKKRPQVVGGHAELDIMIDQQIALEAPTLHTEKLEHMKNCLEGVKEEAQTLVTMRYVEGLSIADICAKLDKKHSAITMKLSRIRNLLKNCIEQKLDGATR